jgi:hypothetical protein
MAWDEVIAALLGGLEGGVGGWQVSRKMKREDEQQRQQAERQAQADARAQAEHDLRVSEIDERRRDRAQRDTGAMLTEIGRGGRLAPEQAARARDLDLGHRVEDTPDFQNSYFRQAGPMPLMVPEVMSRVAPTGAERRADQVAAEKKRADDAARASLEDAIKNLPQHLQGAAQFGSTSGKMPTLGAADFESPEEKSRRAVDQAVEREKRLLPIRLRQREGEKGIDRRYATMPAPMRDDPAMPQGVRSYLGDLVSRYQSDPAGARAELQSAAPSLLRDHPNLDLVKVTQQMNAMLPLPQLTDEEKDAAAQQRAAKVPIPLAKPTPARGERGLLVPGNIDLYRRPKVRNPDGTTSTVRSMSVNIDGREVLIPTVSDDGRVVSDEEAIQIYQRTGKHLGMFDSPESATVYASRLHDEYEAGKYDRPLDASRPDARVSQAEALMKQIQQGRAQGQDTTALEQQLLALKRGTGAAVVH